MLELPYGACFLVKGHYSCFFLMVMILTNLTCSTLVFLPVTNRTEADTSKVQEAEGCGPSSISESEANSMDPYLLITSVSLKSRCVSEKVSHMFQFSKPSSSTQRGQAMSGVCQPPCTAFCVVLVVALAVLEHAL